MSLENIIGVDDASKILKLSPGTVKNKCAAGYLPAKKIGKQWILDKKQLEEWKMKKYNSLNARNSTIFDWEGLELRTNQDPYADIDTYKAIALDQDDNEYNVEWEIIDHETTDESESCDWDNPISVVKI